MALILPAYAKLNLTLDVTGRRSNGYHDIDSVMQTVSLYDLVYVERTDCRVFDLVGPAIEGENLVLKAARELEGHVGRQLPFTIRLFKRIPMGAGLGGGSLGFGLGRGRFAGRGLALSSGLRDCRGLFGGGSGGCGSGSLRSLAGSYQTWGLSTLGASGAARFRLFRRVAFCLARRGGLARH